jgi:putative two-component system response regulator
MSHAVGTRRPTVLVADDSPQNIELLSRELAESSRVKVATSGDRALTIG